MITDLKIYTAKKASENNPRNSEASIIELKDGSLLIAWQCHQKSAHGSDDTAPGVISLANSVDNGATWQNDRIVAKMKDGCVNCYSPSLFRLSDGGICLIFKRYTHLVYYEKILANVYKIVSYDEGKTWSEEEILFKNSEVHPMNHTVKRLKNGELLMPVFYSEGGWCAPDDHDIVYVLKSTDEFKTWTESNRITLPMRGASEPCISESADGTLYMVLRNQLGSVFKSISVDGGSTWSKPQTTGLVAPESCPAIVAVPNSNAQIVIWNNSEYNPTWATHYGKRTPLTMAISFDGLKTFTNFVDIETDPNRAFTNPSFTITSNGLFVLNYWTREYSKEGRMGGLIDLKIATFKVEL